MTPSTATTPGTSRSAAATRSWRAGPATRTRPAPGRREYAPWAVDGNRVVATGTSRYVGPARTYHNVFLIEFDDAGAATSFTEVFAEER